MAVNNLTILRNVWLNGTNDFQQRIPEPTQANINQVIDALFDPMNRMYYNQFIDALVMRIGDTFVHQQEFKNPLAVFKKSRMMYGNTLQEIIPKWIRAHAYVDDAEDVFKMARPDVSVWYHSQNRRDRYDITINDTELRTAFTDSMGLNKLVSSIMNVPINSDEYDEYRIMLQLIAEYDNAWGFFEHSLSAAPTDDETGKEFLYWLRAYARKLQFPTTTYNNSSIEDIPIFVKPSELVILMTPETQAAIDVYTLASVFQLDKAEIQQRIVIVDEFPMTKNDNNVVALLTTEDFFMCKDTEYCTTSMYNPKTLGTNYFLHHWGVYSVSPFVPAILFTVGGETTGTDVVTVSVGGLRAYQADNTLIGTTDSDIVSGIFGLALYGTITPSLPEFSVKPDTATFSNFVLEKTVNSSTVREPIPADKIKIEYQPDAHISSEGIGGNPTAGNYAPYRVTVDRDYLLENTTPGNNKIQFVATTIYNNPSGDTEITTPTVTCNLRYINLTS